MKTTRTITLIAKSNVDGIFPNLKIPNVTSYSVGYKVIWIEYGNNSILAVSRADYEKMTVTDEQNICIDATSDEFERINCRD